ncbi:UNVERIFIED_CONTAM: hypothetical protein RMT77_010857 [Armadillidium vulgare]
MHCIILAIVIVGALGQSCEKDEVIYYPDSQQCDRYTECRDGIVSEQLCPDGLVFNDKVKNGAYPCSYPSEVDCSSRTKLQPAQPTQHCGRAWGYYGSGDRSVCDLFWNCVDGREFQFACPEGLAFSSSTYRCEWPEDSPDCDAAAFLGFSCPAVRDESQFLLVGTPRYSSPRDCRKYFLCVGQAPRLHTCDLGTVFNDEIHGCDEPEHVGGCENYYPREELAEIRARKEKRRLAQEKRQEEYRERFAQLNKL